MANLKNQVDDILKSKTSATTKRKKLVELGLPASDIKVLLSLCKTDGAKTAYTFGVEIECFNVDKELFIATARRNGIDIEMQGYNHDTQKYYKVVTDSSIIGNNAVECVSPVLQGKKDLKTLKTLCDCLNQAGAKVNKSTGLHVHVGLQSIDFETYKNIFINYIALEYVIDSFMPESRRRDNNQYCRGFKNYVMSFQRIINAENYLGIEHVFNTRYVKVNPCSWARHNTIEFRQHSGTTNFEKIEAWINFLTKLIEYSKNNRLTGSVRSIEDIPFLSESEKEYFTSRAAALSESDL